VNEDDARRTGQDVATFAADQADRWKKGLAEWGEDGSRIQRLRDAAEFTIYTPGSTTGIPVSVLTSFARPASDEVELVRERAQTTISSLLALAGVDVEPMKSREHILLTTILLAAWQAGESPDIASLIQRIQQPPMTRIGVIDLESFYPVKERFELAMTINTLIASPGFEVWTQGEPLDVASFFRTSSGRPRVSIFSIAHLNDSQRMFFVALLLNAVVGWMRTQSGTSSLRAMVYMDEIFGFFPPTANPPSKGTAAHAVEAGACGWGVGGARDTEPRRPRLQGALEHRYVVAWKASDRARQGQPAGRTRRCRRSRRLRPRRDRPPPIEPFLARVSHAQRARGPAHAVPVAMDALVPVWAPRSR
jgi:hypothetical protein